MEPTALPDALSESTFTLAERARDPFVLSLLPSALILLTIGHHYGAIAAEPLWAILAAPVAAAVAAVVLVTCFPPGTSRTRPGLFLGVTTGLTGLMLYLTGWGAVFAITLLSVAAFAVFTDGSRCGRMAMVAITATILVGEVGVAVGIFKSMVPASTAHGIAVGETLMAILVVSVMMRAQRDRELAEARERQSEERFRALVQQASDAIVVIESGGRVKYASPAVEHILGCAPHELESFDTTWVDADHVEAMSDVWRRLLGSPGSTESVDVPLRRVDGTSRWVEARLTNLSDSPAVQGFVCNLRDIGERRVVQTQLMHDARHDPLTRLPNRRHFVERLNEVWRTATPDDLIAVLFLDVDHFKEINDEYGHTIGDEALVEVAKKLSEFVRPNDLIARFGGDEFVVLIADIDGTDRVCHIAERISHELSGSRRIRDVELRLTVSIGVATSMGKAKMVEDLVCEADRAMYQAKQNGRARWEHADQAAWPARPAATGTASTVPPTRLAPLV